MKHPTPGLEMTGDTRMNDIIGVLFLIALVVITIALAEWGLHND